MNSPNLIERHWRWRACKKRALDSVLDFSVEGEVTNTPDGVLIYKDNGSSILAVAHLDSVTEKPTFHNPFSDPKHPEYTVCLSTTVDDRLGAYIILDLLPSIGIVPDVLLTEGEETGRSTARHFDAKGKKWNWMFSFDRMGTDVVMYQYETADYRKKLTDMGFRVGIGSFSDICYLSSLGITGFNFGTGYYDNHGQRAHFILEHTTSMVERFTKFWNQYRGEEMAYDATKSYRRYFYGGNRRAWDEYDEEAWDAWAEGRPASAAGGTVIHVSYPDLICDCGKVITGIHTADVRCPDCERGYYYSTGDWRHYATNKERCPLCDGRLTRLLFEWCQCKVCRAYVKVIYPIGVNMNNGNPHFEFGEDPLKTPPELRTAGNKAVGLVQCPQCRRMFSTFDILEVLTRKGSKKMCYQCTLKTKTCEDCWRKTTWLKRGLCRHCYQSKIEAERASRSGKQRRLLLPSSVRHVGNLCDVCEEPSPVLHYEEGLLLCTKCQQKIKIDTGKG